VGAPPHHNLIEQVWVVGVTSEAVRVGGSTGQGQRLPPSGGRSYVGTAVVPTTLVRSRLVTSSNTDKLVITSDRETSRLPSAYTRKRLAVRGRQESLRAGRSGRGLAVC
jgi:hypothetical protein